MDLNEYIKRNYKNPNVQVLKTLDASDNLVFYLTQTPWNTNMQVVESIENVGGGGDDWTVVKLEPTIIDPENPEHLYLMNNKSEDIAKLKALELMYQNNEHPIVIMNYKLHNFGENTYSTILNKFDEHYGGQDFNAIIGEVIISVGDHDTYFLCENNNTSSALLDEFIEIKYKKDKYYTLTIDSFGYETEYTVEQNSSWTLGDVYNMYGIALSDGTNTYYSGDTIIFNNDMILTYVEITTG